MGREIASLKVVLRETEQNLQSKVIENDKLKTHLSRMEDEVDNLSKSLELQAKLPRVDTVDKLNTPSIFTDRQISDYLPSSSQFVRTSNSLAQVKVQKSIITIPDSKTCFSKSYKIRMKCASPSVTISSPTTPNSHLKWKDLQEKI